MPYKCVEVEVEVTLEDFEDSDLVTELEDRGYKVLDPDFDSDIDSVTEKLYYALRDKDHNKIYDLAKEVITNTTGRII